MQQGKQQLNIKLDQTTPLTCENCENDTFVEVLYIRKISKFIVGADQDALYPIPVFACSKCHHVNSDMQPKEKI